MNVLDDQEKANLRAAHKKERDGRIRDRIKAVLLYEEGWTQAQIAKALLIDGETVRRHIAEYNSQKKLKPVSGGSEEKLSAEQSRLLTEHLEQHIYLYVKDIVEYVRIEFSVEYTIAGLRDWLKRRGFSYKKPAVVPGKADKEAQEKWLVEYEKLKAELPKEETICFTDGVHPTHNVQPAYGWIKRGQRKEIPANSGRARLNLSGIIDVISHKVMVTEDKTLNADAMITFFRGVEKAYPEKKKIHVFCDNARYYRNQALKEYLKKSKVELHFLPPYSPNLNPIERLWKWMKERVIYNAYYEKFEEFRRAIFGFFHALQVAAPTSELGKSLRCRVGDRFSPISAPNPAF